MSTASSPPHPTLDGLLAASREHPADPVARGALADYLREQGLWDRDAVSRLVWDRPEDDVPRLLYADLLAEQAAEVACHGCKGRKVRSTRAGPRSAIVDCWDCSGSGRVQNPDHARSEFIRVQVELAKPCTACGGDGEYDADHRPGKMQCRLCFGRKTLSGPQADALRRRERELGLAHCREWFPNPSPGDWRWHLSEWEASHPTGPGWVVRRGFPDAARLSLAAFLGGACGRCGGSGTGEATYRPSGYKTCCGKPTRDRWDVGNQRGGHPPKWCSVCWATYLPEHTGWDSCTTCKGRKRTPGLAAALGGLPLTRIELAGKEPMEGAGGWYWGSAIGRGELIPGYLPISSALWKATRSGQTPIIFPTPDAAHSALSAACVAVARDAYLKKQGGW